MICLNFLAYLLIFIYSEAALSQIFTFIIHEFYLLMIFDYTIGKHTNFCTQNGDYFTQL